jgi:hypothetical protein
VSCEFATKCHKLTVADSVSYRFDGGRGRIRTYDFHRMNLLNIINTTTYNALTALLVRVSRVSR